MMVFLDIAIMVFALGFFFLRAGQEYDRTELRDAERRDAALTSR